MLKTFITTCLLAGHIASAIPLVTPQLYSSNLCIENLYVCGPLSPQGYGTITQCKNSTYVHRTTCDALDFHKCGLISGVPFCSEGAGSEGVRSFVRRAGDEQFNLVPSIPRLIPSVPQPVGEIGKDVVDPATVYGKQGLSRCQFDIVLKMTSVFETSNPNWVNVISLGFDICGNWNDGQGISAGFIQFTTSSGSALQVVLAYLTLTQRTNPPIASFVAALQTARSVGNQGQVSGQGFMSGLWGFCDAWREANTNDAAAFQGAQMKIQSDGYLAPNEGVVKRLGIKTALGVAQIMDTGIQLGYGAIEEIAKNAGWSPAQGATETDFLWRYLDARIMYLNNLGGAYPGTKYRIDSYRHMLQKGNLNFAGGSVEMLENGGNPMTITC
ncbi:hypothetical protein HDU67_008817 [Dinochytrium kinnereticum]|nr:hypothetical protein HDU67_008817 [Dinochytrium kinnereticum]